MNLHTVADYIAAHAVVMLSGLTLAMVLLTAVLWQFVGYIGPRMVRYIEARSDAWGQHAFIRRVQSAPLLGGALTATFHRTLSVGRYLGIHAVISFFAALVAIMAFVEVADEIGIDESIANFDMALSQALAEHLSDSVLRACAVLTHLGDGDVLVVLGGTIALLLFVRREFVLAWAWIVTTACGGIMTRLLKAWFARTRPLHDHGFATAEGWSFPSGHASGSMLVYGLLGYLIVRHTRAEWHIPVVVMTVALVVFIGASRVLLQVHFLSDVLAGWASAAVWMALCIAGLEAVRRRRLGKAVDETS